MFDIEKLLNAVDLVRLVEVSGSSLKPHKGGYEHRGPCPLHGGDNPTAFSVFRDNDHKLRWHCYTKCGTGGDAIGFVKLWRNLDFLDAVKWLAEYARLPLADIGFTPERAAEIAAAKLRSDVMDLAAAYFAESLWLSENCQALEYVRGRGFTDENIRLSGWGFSKGDGLKSYLETHGADMEIAREAGLIRADGFDFTCNANGREASPAGYLIYPHRDWAGAGVYYFSSRALSPMDPGDKSRNLPGSRQLYKAEAQGSRTVIIVEGPADAESLRQLGFSAWALCGLGSLPENALRLLKQRKAVYLMLDQDDAGQGTVSKIANLIGPLTLIVAAALPEGVKDANDLLRREGTNADTIRTLLTGAGVWIEKQLERVNFTPAHELDMLTSEIAWLLRQLPENLQPRYYKLSQRRLGMTRQEVLAMVNEQKVQENGHLGLSQIRDGQLCFVGEPLGNFSAWITHELTRENGQDMPTVEYTVTGRLADGEPLREVTVPADTFSDMGWLARYWGARAIPYVSRSKGYMLARAIQEISLKDLTQEHVYTFTGWVTIDGIRGYLSGSGFLSPDGLDESVRVDLGTNNLRHYTLPAPPEKDALQKAVTASLNFLDIGPLHVTAPLWAAMFAAPLTEIKPLYTVLWVYGGTQSGKSTVTHLALTHFGTGFVDGRQYHSPDNWESTITALESSMFITKDAPIVVDDYAPQFASAGDAREMQRKAQKMVRSVGNRAARGRAMSSLKMQQTRIPRGLVIVTAELPLAGESTVGRMLYIPIERGDVLPRKGDPPRTVLNQAQLDGQAGLYGQAMSAYLRYLTVNWEPLTERFLEIVEESARFARAKSGELQNRLPDYFAILDAAQQTALTAFHEMGYLSFHEAVARMTANSEAILSVVINQAEKVAAESPVRKFFDALDSLLERGKVYLAPRKNDVIFNRPEHADLVGWFDTEEERVYLSDAACLEHVRDFWANLGEHFDTTTDALRRQFSQIGGLLAERGDGRNLLVSKYIDGKTRRALAIATPKIFELYGVNLANEKQEVPYRQNGHDKKSYTREAL